MPDIDARCEWIRERIDAFLDDALDASERARVAGHAAACAACAGELALAERVLREVRSLPAFEAPAHVVESAQRAAVGPGAARGVTVIPLAPRTARRRLLPALAAVVVVVALSVWFAARERAGDLFRTAASEAEVEQAAADVALAFGYVGKYSDRAAAIIRDDVLERRVAPRVEKAIETSREAAVDDALVPGLKRALHKAGLDVTSPPPGRS